MPKSTVVATSEPKREVSEICALVARWNWLDADQEYQALIAETDDESERLGTIHDPRLWDRQLAPGRIQLG